MPIYEYRCKDCGNEFEHLHKRLNEDAPACPECGHAEVTKKLSTFSANVKSGSGSVPCESGSCPTGTCPTSSCAGGACPFS